MKNRNIQTPKAHQKEHNLLVCMIKNLKAGGGSLGELSEADYANLSNKITELKTRGATIEVFISINFDKYVTLNFGGDDIEVSPDFSGQYPRYVMDEQHTITYINGTVVNPVMRVRSPNVANMTYFWGKVEPGMEIFNLSGVKIPYDLSMDIVDDADFESFNPPSTQNTSLILENNIPDTDVIFAFNASSASNATSIANPPNGTVIYPQYPLGTDVRVRVEHDSTMTLQIFDGAGTLISSPTTFYEEIHGKYIAQDVLTVPYNANYKYVIT